MARLRNIAEWSICCHSIEEHNRTAIDEVREVRLGGLVQREARRKLERQRGASLLERAAAGSFQASEISGA